MASIADSREDTGDWREPSDPGGTRRPRFTGYPFTLGVASGAPEPTSVVLWTRLAPEPLGGRRGRLRRGRRALGDGRRRAFRARRRPRRGRCAVGASPQRARRGRRAVPGPLVLVPVHRRGRRQPGRTNADDARDRRTGRRPALCDRVLPAVRTGLFRGTPPSGRRGPRSDALRGRLRLRVIVGRRPRASPCRRRAPNAGRVPHAARPVQDRS